MMLKSNNENAAYELFFGSLANSNRFRIIKVLRGGKKNVTEICKLTRFEQTMVSHNLKRLERCGMVFPEREGKCCYYRVNVQTIGPLLKLIDSHIKQYCCKVVERKRK